MPRFTYRVKEGPSRVLEGTIDAETKTAAADKLVRAGYFPIEIKEEMSPEKRAAFSFRISGKIKPAHLAIFTRQLSDLLGSGLAILNALGVLAEQTENAKLRAVVTDVQKNLRDGGTFSDALARHPSAFSELYVSMVKAGEVSGTLEGVLLRLADYAESREEFRSKIKTAMAYPMLVSFVGFGTIWVLLTFVVPKLVTIFEEMRQELPLITTVLVSISMFMSKYWWAFIGALALGIFAFKRALKVKESKLAIDRLKLRLPVLGGLSLKVEVANFTRTLLTLLANGVPILKALDVARDTMTNDVMKGEIERLLKDVRDGASLAIAMKRVSYFPPFVTNMVAIGEESGKLEEALGKVTTAYERDAERAMKVMTSLLEPILILVMGSIVGFIVIAMLMPIFQISILVK